MYNEKKTDWSNVEIKAPPKKDPHLFKKKNKDDKKDDKKKDEKKKDEKKKDDKKDDKKKKK